MNRKDIEWSGLLKVPDSALLKDALIEIGQLKAYITELQYKINTPDNKKMNNLVESITALRRNNKNLQEENNRMRTELRKLLVIN